MPHTETDTETIHFQCRHIFTDGHRCQSPTLRAPRNKNHSNGPEGPEAHENFCYYHHTTRGAAAQTRDRVPHPRRATRGRVGSGKDATFTLPLLEDRSAIQLAIGEVLQRIASNDIDPRRAGLLLYGLQIASLNLKQDHRSASGSAHRDEPFEEAATVSEIVLDPTLGPLAPPAKLHSTEPKGTAQLLLEELCGDDEEEEAADEEETATTLPSLHATYTATAPNNRRYTRDDGPLSLRQARTRARNPRSPAGSAQPLRPHEAGGHPHPPVALRLPLLRRRTHPRDRRVLPR